MPTENPNFTPDSLSSPEKSTRPNLAFGEYLPEKIIKNQDVVKMGVIKNYKGEPISEIELYNKYGVESRHRAGPEETPLFMGRKAAQEAYDKNPEKADVVIVTTCFPVKLPSKKSLSWELAQEFGTPNCLNFTFHSACSSLGWALHFIREAEEEFLGQRLLFVDTQSNHRFFVPIEENLDSDGKPKDKSWQAVFFNDVANAMIVPRYGEDMRVLCSQPYTFSKEINETIKMPIDESLLTEDSILYPSPASISGKVEQDGSKVYQIMCKYIPSLIRKDLKEFPDVRKVDINQTSAPLVDGVSKRMPGFDITKDCKDGYSSSGSTLRSWRKAYSKDEIASGDRRAFAVMGAGLLLVVGGVEFGLKPEERKNHEVKREIPWQERREKFMKSVILLTE